MTAANAFGDSSSETKRFVLVILYGCLIIYGSLYPFQGWQAYPGGGWGWLVPGLMQRVSKGDVVINVLAYIPLGLLIAERLSCRCNRFAALIGATVIGLGISYLMECLQAFLPNRVSSMIDVVLNGIGTSAGALVGVAVGVPSMLGEKLRELRREWILPGVLHSIGLGVLALWALSQLAPFVPSFDVGKVKNGLKPLWYTIHDLKRFRIFDAAVYSLNFTGLGIVAALTAKPGYRILPVFAFCGMVVLFFKIPVMGRQLSSEALVGLVGGVSLSVFLCRLPRSILVTAAAISLLAAFVIYEVQPVASSLPACNQFNWVPFRYHMTNVITGLEGILEGLWPFAALSYLILLTSPTRKRSVSLMGGALIFALVFGLEWLQHHIPGRNPDITQAIIADIGWSAPFFFTTGNIHDKQNEHFEQTKRSETSYLVKSL